MIFPVLVITNGTATRMAVIAARTGSELMAGAKAMMIETLKEKLRNGVAHFMGDVPVLETTSTTATFKMLGNPCCQPNNNLRSVNGTAPTTEVVGGV